jgi:tetratricopeptide (TPR) repeat protein
MDTQFRSRWSWLILLLLLGGTGGVFPASASEEGPPQAAGQAAALEEAKRLHAETATLYEAGQYAAALPVAQQVLALVEQALGPAHPDVADSLNTLAQLYRLQGQYAQAEPLYRRALAIQEQALGPSHPDVARSLNNLALLYLYQGQYAQVEPLLQRARTIQEQALGPSHPDVARSLSNLAVLAWAQGDIDRALPLLTRSSAISDHTLTLMLTLGTEAQKLASAMLLSADTSAVVSFHTQVAPHDPQALRLALTTILRRKGRVLEAMSETLTTLRHQVQSADQQLLAQWATVRGALATLMWRGLGAQSPEAYRTELARLEAQGQQLEAQLSAQGAAFRAQTQPPTLEQVQAALPADTVLVELAVYTPYTPPQQWAPPRYVAYVLPPRGEPIWAELGEAATIDQAVAQFRSALSNPRHCCVQEAARALDTLVMQPLRPLLGAARHLLLSPDGALQLVPFGALVDETQHYLLERVTVSYLTTGRDLLRPASPRPTPQPPLVVGNPDFTPPRPSCCARSRRCCLPCCLGGQWTRRPSSSPPCRAPPRR